MATGKNFIAYVEDCLNGVRGVRFKAMFGEYALYFNDVVVGLVCDQTVFIKVTHGTSILLKGRVDTAPPFPGGKDAFVLTESELEDHDLIGQVLAAAHCDLAMKSTPKKKQRR